MNPKVITKASWEVSIRGGTRMITNLLFLMCHLDLLTNTEDENLNTCNLGSLPSLVAFRMEYLS